MSGECPADDLGDHAGTGEQSIAPAAMSSGPMPGL
jgi:hypothetical protein